MDCVFGGEEVLPEDWTMLRKQIGCTAGTSCNVRSDGYFPSSSNIGKFLSTDWQDCAHQCFMHPQCKFWSYELLRDCYLKSESAYSGWVPGDNWKSGNKACGDSAIRSPNKTPTRDTAGTSCNVRSGGYFPSSSNIGKFLSTDWQDCAHQCFMHPQCKFWSHELLRDCYLKSESAYSGWVP